MSATSRRTSRSQEKDTIPEGIKYSLRGVLATLKGKGCREMAGHIGSHWQEMGLLLAHCLGNARIRCA